MSSDYTTQKLIERVTLKAFTSSSSSLSPQQVLDLANDSLRSFLVPMTATLREEWWIGRTDIVLTTDASGFVTVPDSVASSLRTVSWSNAGILTPLTRVEPEMSFNYLPVSSNVPIGFQLRGYSLQVLPPTPGISLHLTAMLRPPTMVLTDAAAEIDSQASNVLTLDSVPLEWQETAPTQVDIISGVSPFQKVDTFDVTSLVVATKLLTLTTAPTLTGEAWVSDVGTSPFASVPVELYPLLEQDVIVQLFGAVGDKRLPAAEKRRDSLEAMAKAAMAPRVTGNARVITNPSAPGMRSLGGLWPRR